MCLYDEAKRDESTQAAAGAAAVVAAAAAADKPRPTRGRTSDSHGEGGAHGGHATSNQSDGEEAEEERSSNRDDVTLGRRVRHIEKVGKKNYAYLHWAIHTIEGMEFGL